MLYGTNVRTGDCVSYRPCEECQICRVVPRSADLNGTGIERRAEDHSSFESPATIRLPFTYDISVIVIIRGSWRAPGFAAGASVRFTDACRVSSSETFASSPERFTRTIMGCASGPRPRIT